MRCRQIHFNACDRAPVPGLRLRPRAKAACAVATAGHGAPRPHGLCCALALPGLNRFTAPVPPCGPQCPPAADARPGLWRRFSRADFRTAQKSDPRADPTSRHRGAFVAGRKAPSMCFPKRATASQAARAAEPRPTRAGRGIYNTQKHPHVHTWAVSKSANPNPTCPPGRPGAYPARGLVSVATALRSTSRRGIAAAAAPSALLLRGPSWRAHPPPKNLWCSSYFG